MARTTKCRDSHTSLVPVSALSALDLTEIQPPSPTQRGDRALSRESICIGVAFALAAVHDARVSLLNDLPRPGATRLAVRVTPDALRRIRGGHPWLFDGSIISASRSGGGTSDGAATTPTTGPRSLPSAAWVTGAAPGDLAVIFDNDRRFAAIGLWDPASPIRVKILHHGSRATIDQAWFAARIATAVARRALLAESGTTTAYRVIHGENDGFPGLVVDRYGHVLVVKLYSAAWVPHLADVVRALLAALPSRSVVLRLARAIRDQPLHGLTEGMSLYGPEVDSPVQFLEHGLRFQADVIRGQKTGHFLDQRDNRALVGSMSAGARVLDLFSCTGGFSVHAAAGGARSVLSVDSSPGAIDFAERNMALNLGHDGVAVCRHTVRTGEAFAVLEELGQSRGRFDVVVVDPPSFARNAASVPQAIQAYQRLAELAAPLVERDGLLVMSSCSARVDEADFVRAVHAGCARVSIELDEVRRTGHAIDHPIGFPEGAYLNTLYARPHKVSRR